MTIIKRLQHKSFPILLASFLCFPAYALEKITDTHLSEVTGQAGLEVHIEESLITQKEGSPFFVGYIDNNCGNFDCTFDGNDESYHGGIFGLDMSPNGAKPGYVKFSGSISLDVVDGGELEKSSLSMIIKNSELEMYIPSIVVGSSTINQFDSLSTELSSNANFITDPGSSFSSFGGVYAYLNTDAEVLLFPGGEMGDSGLELSFKAVIKDGELAWEDDINNGGGTVSLSGLTAEASGTGFVDIVNYTINDFDYKAIRITADTDVSFNAKNMNIGTGRVGSTFGNFNVSFTGHVLSRK